MENKSQEAYTQPAPLPNKGELLAFAEYHDPLIPEYKGNPCIESLPRILTKSETISLLENYPEYKKEYRSWPSELRLHLIQTITDVFVVLAHHWDLEQRISRMIRSGYKRRNPLARRYYPELLAKLEDTQFSSEAALAAFQISPVTLGFTLVGISGIGKTTALNAVLALYPRVIIHNNYLGEDFHLVQLPWIKLDCPHDGGLRGLCFSFFTTIDGLLNTNYYQRYTRNGRASKDEMLPHMARLAALHSVGGLFIDEIQILVEVRNNASHMLNFLVQLYNTVGVPIVLVGTFKAVPLLSEGLRPARRGTGQGDFVWDRMQPGPAWDEFVASLWSYQYTAKECPLNRRLSQVLYEETQGVTDFAVKLYMLAQARAITNGTETITVGLIRATARECLRLAQPVLTALRENNFDALRSIEDVYINYDLLIAELLEKARKQSDINAKEPAIQNGTESGESYPLTEPDVTSEALQSAAHPSDDASGLVTAQPAQPPLVVNEVAPTETNLVNTSTADKPAPNSPSRKRQSKTSGKSKGKLPEAAPSDTDSGLTAFERLSDEGYTKLSDEYL
jgi:hypothetical protein